MSRCGRIKALDPEAIKVLCKYDWPGNVRELEAVMERVTVLCSGDKINVSDLPIELREGPRPSADVQWKLPPEGIDFEQWEREMLAQALREASGVMSEAAKRLGMTYRTFQYRAMKFGLKGH
jgi:DNA-binding NtrC family response regulator